jgi:hypothetical protein
MKNDSNQTGALLLLAIVLGAASYAFIFKGSEFEQNNLSSNFGQFSKNTTSNFLSNNKAVTATENYTKENRSNFSGNALPEYKIKSTSGGNYAHASNVDFPSNGIEQSDIQSYREQARNVSASSSRLNSGFNYAQNQTRFNNIGSTSVDYISNTQNPTKSDINALFLLDTHAAEAAMTQEGSKRALPSLAGKTASISANLSSNKTVKKKLDGNTGAGDPVGLGGSLRVGDGVLILLLLLGIYCLTSIMPSQIKNQEFSV